MNEELINIGEKPPDEQIFRMVKCPLKSVLKNYDIIQPIIENAVKDINQLVIYGYQFIRLYFLDKFNKNEDLPTINKSFILDILKTIGTTKTNKGKQKTDTKIANKDTKTDIRKFYDNEFSKLVDEKISYSNMTHIVEQTAKEMITCIETNISTHFVKYLFKYINCLFKIPKTKLIKQEKDKEIRKQLYKELNKEIRELKSDLINNKIEESKEEYHQWIKENKKYLFPEKVTKNVAYDVKVHTNKYLKYSIYINKKIEELGFKPYNFTPQRNNLVPKHIKINTVAMADLFPTNNKIFEYPKSELVLHSKKYQRHIWSKILKLEKKNIFKKDFRKDINNDDYVFYNEISTDGFSCSLLFILNKYKDKKFGEKLPTPIDEDDKFMSLEQLNKKECKKYLSNDYKIVSVDPGMRRPISMIDENNNYYKYSACRRRFETYTKRCNEIILNEKNKNNIIEKETELSKFNSRTLKQNEYKKFIINKNKINKQVNKFYNNILFRKLDFRRFIRTKQSETNLLNEIENKYLTKNEQKQGRKLLIAHGNWSRDTAMKGCIPTPNKGIKKLLASRFEIIDVNEYNTSKLYNKTFTELENVNVRRNKHKKHLHEILTLKGEPDNRIFVNRDINACKNILYLAKYYLQYQDRPKEFQREEKSKNTKTRKNKKEIVV